MVIYITGGHGRMEQGERCAALLQQLNLQRNNGIYRAHGCLGHGACAVRWSALTLNWTLLMLCDCPLVMIGVVVE